MIKQLSLGALIAPAALMTPCTFAAGQPGGKLEAAFKKADTDKDGTVSEKEIHDYMKAQRPKK